MEVLERCKERDTEILDRTTAAFRNALEELLPRLHLYSYEHGPTVRLASDILLRIDEDLSGSVDLVVTQTPPRASSHFGLDDTPASTSYSRR